MLILTRKKDDRIMIGEDIVITVVSCEDGRVKIGIDAPKDVRVFRQELVETREDNRAAAETAAESFDRLIENMSKESLV